MIKRKEIIYIQKHLKRGAQYLADDIKTFKSYEKGAITPMMAYKKFLKNNDMREEYVSLATFESWIRGLGYIR